MAEENGRQVFAFKGAAGETLHVDPLEAYDALTEATGGELNALIEAVQPQPRGPDGKPLEEPPERLAQRATARLRLTAAARRTFHLPPVEPATGQGVPARVAQQALYDFLRWLEGNAGGAAG